MNDRELLEAAAKAAGIKGWWSDDRDYPSVPVSNNGRVERWWNPLTDDGDALRLAVKLSIDIELMQGMVIVSNYATSDVSTVCVDWEKSGDPYAATRRAIVRAAASLQSSKA